MLTSMILNTVRYNPILVFFGWYWTTIQYQYQIGTPPVFTDSPCVWFINVLISMLIVPQGTQNYHLNGLTTSEKQGQLLLLSSYSTRWVFILQHIWDANHLGFISASSVVLFSYYHASLGGSQSWFPTRHEAGGRWLDGAAAGVCCHGDEDCAPATEDPLWRLGGRIWPVGGLRVSRPLPCGLVSADRLPAPTASFPEWEQDPVQLRSHWFIVPPLTPRRPQCLFWHFSCIHYMNIRYRCFHTWPVWLIETQLSVDLTWPRPLEQKLQKNKHFVIVAFMFL